MEEVVSWIMQDAVVSAPTANACISPVGVPSGPVVSFKPQHHFTVTGRLPNHSNGDDGRR